jgi:heme-degrading monooxygenase HmoA
MIVEHALLSVRDGQAAAFEAALRQAVPLIAASPGFRGIEVRPADDGNIYLLLVRWDDIASHRDGFRQSARYREWRALLHHFYDPMPEVRYFAASIIDNSDLFK